jgi:hypothetical protein
MSDGGIEALFSIATEPPRSDDHSSISKLLLSTIAVDFLRKHSVLRAQINGWVASAPRSLIPDH